MKCGQNVGQKMKISFDQKLFDKKQYVSQKLAIFHKLKFNTLAKIRNFS